MAANSSNGAKLRHETATAETHSAIQQEAAGRELHIEIHKDEYVRFVGSARHLTEEGFIPDGFEWPTANDGKRWEAKGLCFWLRRTRPEGHKGPMRSWLELDNWTVRIGVVGRDWRWSQRCAIERKAKELQDTIYAQSPAGQRELLASVRALRLAREDKAFQAFNAKFIPQRKKPGRPAKSIPNSAA